MSQRIVPASLPSDLLNIIEAGVLAPSADNHHCFEVRASPGCILLFGSKAFLTAPYHRKVLSLISFGAVVENMTLRATRRGYRVTVSWLPDPVRPTLIAGLRLTKGEPRGAALDVAIAWRHTNRRVVFSGPHLSEAELAGFARLIEDIPGVALTFFDSGWRRRALLRLVWSAEAERFNIRALHEDLFSSVRFDVGWHATAEEGLPPAALCVEPGMRWAFAQLRRWPVLNALRHIGFHYALGFRAAYLPCYFAPHRGVLTTNLPIEQGAVLVGRALQRIWLKAEILGLAFQPLAGSALLALAKYSAVPVETGARLRHGWKDLTDETPMMVFRMGRAKRPAIRAGRQALENCLPH